jgi:predicted nucleotidyltransferase
VRSKIPIPTQRLDEFCRRWKIAELGAFGSAPREDFRADGDLDLLVRFAPDADWSLMDHVAMEEELAGIVGRKVDLVSQRAIERSSNWIRRKAILDSAEPFLPRVHNLRDLVEEYPKGTFEPEKVTNRLSAQEKRSAAALSSTRRRSPCRAS